VIKKRHCPGGTPVAAVLKPRQSSPGQAILVAVAFRQKCVGLAILTYVLDLSGPALACSEERRPGSQMRI